MFASTPARSTVAFPELTEREREVLDLIAAGKTNAQIASALFLSPKTVRNNVSMILAKLHATDRPTMIIKARDAGFGTGPDTASSEGRSALPATQRLTTSAQNRAVIRSRRALRTRGSLLPSVSKSSSSRSRTWLRSSPVTLLITPINRAKAASARR